MAADTGPGEMTAPNDTTTENKKTATKDCVGMRKLLKWS